MQPSNIISKSLYTYIYIWLVSQSMTGATMWDRFLQTGGNI